MLAGESALPIQIIQSVPAIPTGLPSLNSPYSVSSVRYPSGFILHLHIRCPYPWMALGNTLSTPSPQSSSAGGQWNKDGAGCLYSTWGWTVSSTHQPRLANVNVQSSLWQNDDLILVLMWMPCPNDEGVGNTHVGQAEQACRLMLALEPLVCEWCWVDSSRFTQGMRRPTKSSLSSSILNPNWKQGTLDSEPMCPMYSWASVRFT